LAATADVASRAFLEAVCWHVASVLASVHAPEQTRISVHVLRKAEARKQYKGKKYMPLDLRPKKTRKIRRALKTEQKYAKTLRQKTRESNFPMRRFAVTM
jgi:hypothetical protein